MWGLFKEKREQEKEIRVAVDYLGDRTLFFLCGSESYFIHVEPQVIVDWVKEKTTKEGLRMPTTDSLLHTFNNMYLQAFVVTHKHLWQQYSPNK